MQEIISPQDRAEQTVLPASQGGEAVRKPRPPAETVQMAWDIAHELYSEIAVLLPPDPSSTLPENTFQSTQGDSVVRAERRSGGSVYISIHDGVQRGFHTEDGMPRLGGKHAQFYELAVGHNKHGVVEVWLTAFEEGDVSEHRKTKRVHIDGVMGDVPSLTGTVREGPHRPLTPLEAQDGVDGILKEVQDAVRRHKEVYDAGGVASETEPQL